jgi:hypothetical protein
LDYGSIDCHFRDVYCDDAQPAIDALIHGDLHRFFATQPLMGPVTLFLRAPFAALAGLHDYDLKLIYQLGALPCLLVLAAVALWVAATIRERGGPWWRAALTGALLLVNPMVFRALDVGHPEELVVSALCVATAIALIKGRTVLAGLLLGGALASKLWAVLIAPAVALVPIDRRELTGLVAAAAAVVLVLYAPMVAGDAGRVKGSFEAANKLGTRAGTVTSVNVWWFVAHRTTSFDRAAILTPDGRIITKREVGFTLDSGVARVTHPVVVALAALLALLWARSPGRRRRPETLLLLFALVFMVRCVLDPGNSSYYHLPALTALVAYEGIACRRPPFVSALLIACLQAMNWAATHIHSDAGFGVFYLAWALPMIAGLALWLFRFSSGSAATEPVRPGAAAVVQPSTAS